MKITRHQENKKEFYFKSIKIIDSIHVLKLFSGFKHKLPRDRALFIIIYLFVSKMLQ